MAHFAVGRAIAQALVRTGILHATSVTLRVVSATGIAIMAVTMTAKTAERTL
jgi:hypothetical protein